MESQLRRLAFETLEARTVLSATSPLEVAVVEEVIEDISAVPAFPGAEGFGAQTVGGRGGRVIEVTNLNSQGPGSLRAAIEAEGPRIVVFRVSGTIELHKALKINNPYLTIAGQTAPGGGITLKNYELSIRTHDVIVQYMRIRTGPTVEEDSISLVGAENVILDHNSFSWSTDENASATRGSKNITIQWNIISEGLRNSTHPEGAHSMGSLFSGVTNLSLHHNLYAHNDSRNARLGNANDDYGVQVVDMVNNVFYNWGQRATEVKDYVDANIVGNYFKAGPDTTAWAEAGLPEIVLIGDDVERSIYVDGNYAPECSGECEDDWHLVGEKDGDPGHRSFQSLTRHETPPVTTTSAQAAYDQVLAQAGARLPLLDSVDQRIITDVISRTGRIIDDPSDVGAWPHLEWGTAPPDSDHDGMPDAWEKQHGLDPHDPDDGRLDADADGYTNLEEWMNSMTPAGAARAAIDDNAATEEDTPVVIDVLANDGDGDQDARMLQTTSDGDHGTVVINSDQTVTYTPHADFHGADTFSYIAADDNGDEHSADVYVVVNSVGDAPVATDDWVITQQGTPVTVNVLANDYDPDGDDIYISHVADGEHGSASAVGYHAVSYTPEPGYFGTDKFTYTIADASGALRTASVSVVVNQVISLHVADLSAQGVDQEGRTWKGVVSITVRDSSGEPVAGARVTGVFKQGNKEVEVICFTDAQGTCIADSGVLPSRRRRATFTVTQVEHTDFDYLPQDNTDPDGGLGIAIELARGETTLDSMD